MYRFDILEFTRGGLEHLCLEFKSVYAIRLNVNTPLLQIVRLRGNFFINYQQIVYFFLWKERKFLEQVENILCNMLIYICCV